MQPEAGGRRLTVQRLRIAIAGCGTAGLAAALLLHRDGHDVVLFERFDAAGPVGSGLMLQPTGLAVLATLGLAEDAIARGARIDRLFGSAGRSGRTVLDVRYAALGRGDRFGVGIHRGALFAVLHDAVVAAGIEIRTGHAVTGTLREGDARRLVFAKQPASERFALVIDAMGARSGLAAQPSRPLPYGALWTTVPWPGDDFDAQALQQRYRGASVMAGVLPVGQAPGAAGSHAAFFWSLRGDRLAAWHDAGLEAWKREVTTLWPETAEMLAGITDPAQLTFARYAHRTLRAPAEPGLIHLGDAWHSTSPQLGQGANMALLDAHALALALRGTKTVDAACAQAVRLRRRHVRLYQAMSRLFTPVYQSDGRVLPFLRDRLVGPLSKRWPATRLQAAMVSGLVGSPLGALGLE
ncbi:FAD-dependent oxidoreductase [Sphingomonas sp. CJ20]